MNDIELFDYDLPRELIAQEPLATRSDARLMVVDRTSRSIEHYHVRDLPGLISPDDAIVVNNSRVVAARLVGYRVRTRGRWQGLFLRADEQSGVWEVLTKTRGTLVAGEEIAIEDRDARHAMSLVVIARTDEGHLLVKPKSLGFDQDANFTEPADWLDAYGRVPIPPYIRDGQMVDSDLKNYQTVYAESRGSVAAPTAGLHFTRPLIDQLEARGVALAEVTLHVGIGTFRPIQTSSLDQHEMHSEWGQIDAKACEVIRRRKAAGGRCIAVGTTSVRVLESAAASRGGELQPWLGETRLFIRPPYAFKAVDAMMTNFHLPRSSLLVMVSAFASRELILHAYQVAIEQEYRFYSYGDAMLIV